MPASGFTPVLQELSSISCCVWGSHWQKSSLALGGKHRYPLLFWKLPSNWGRLNEAAARVQIKQQLYVKHKPQGQAASVSFLLKLKSSDTLNWFISASKEMASLCFPSPSTASRWKWHPAKPCCNLHQEWNASAHTCAASVIPHFTMPAVRKGNGGFWVNHWTSR